jgi:hypothetical protein
MDTRRSVIHPNPGGPTKAESPYDRKLGEAVRLIRSLLIVAPECDKSELLLIAGMLDVLVEK